MPVQFPDSSPPTPPGGDRGGIQDLIATLHKSKIPILCICNDKYNQKLRSLRNHCLELDFRRPTKEQIGKRVMEIARREGLAMNEVGGGVALELLPWGCCHVNAGRAACDQAVGVRGTVASSQARAGCCSP